MALAQSPQRATESVIHGESPQAIRKSVIHAGHPLGETRSRTYPRSPSQALDAFFRREDTWPARVLTRLSGRKGVAYTASRTKRGLDLAVGVPAALVALPIVVILLLLNKMLHPHYPAVFLQDRIGRGEDPVRIIKIRSMAPAAKPGSGLTRFARFIRRHYLDELPQLLQVPAGRLSVVGVRVLPAEIYDDLKEAWSAERFSTWSNAYRTTSLGLTGVHQVFRGPGKEDRRRFHRDMFYARHAGLGLDLYILWRTLRSTDG